MPETKRKFLIWDFDGTLAWRPGGWTSAMLTVLRQNQPELKATPEQVSPFLQSGFPWHAPENPHPEISPVEWWDEMLPVFARAFKGIGVQNGQAYKLAQEVRSAYLEVHTWQRYNDVLPTLEILSARGWKHVLLTNHVPELPMLLDHLGLRSYFAGVFNSAITGYEKPNPKAFRTVTDWVGQNATCWVIGDRYPTDIQGAKEAGLPAILVRKPHPDAPIFCATLNEIVEKI